MNALLSIKIQKLFLVAVILKVASAFLGWYFQRQWSLGFALPLLVMAAYIGLGLKRHDREVTDEKFADSCYYLGFIFTITSIVFSLFDLPSIGERIQDIAVRFGAGMVSTVAGLIVRVYLVSFRPDTSDALKGAEDAVLEAAQRFREQLVMAYEKLADFQGQVTAATESSVDAVKHQVEKLAQDHSVRMERVFVELNERNQEAVTLALSEVSSASSRMSQSVDGYSESMKGSLQSLGDRVEAFGEAVTQRLKTTTFPDDYFASRLAAPLEQLKAASLQVSEHVQSAANGANDAATVLASAIRKLTTKATQAEESLDTVLRLTVAQHSLFDTSASQLEQLKKLGDLLEEVQKTLQVSTTAMAASAASNAEVKGSVTAVVAAVEVSQQAVVDAMRQVSTRLDAELDATSALGRQVQSSEAATKALTQELRSSSAVAQQLTSKLEVEASTKPEWVAIEGALRVQQDSIAAVLSRLDSKSSGVSIEVAAAASQLKGLTERLDVLMSKLTPGQGLPASAALTVPVPVYSTPLHQPSASGSVPAVSPSQPTADAAFRPPGFTPSVSYFPGPPPSTPSGRPDGGPSQG